MLEDFDSVPPVFWAPGGPSPITSTVSTDTSVSGSNSWKHELGAAVPYGHWGGFVYGLVRSLSCATDFKMWYKSDAPISLTWYWQEGTTNGANGEEWETPLTFVGDNIWHEVSIPLNAFTGGTTPDPQSIVQITFYGIAPYGPVTFYIDDVQFSSSALPTETFTVSPTPTDSRTFDPLLTESPTNSPTHSPTASPSPSATPTITVIPDLQVSLSAAPSPVVMLGTSVNLVFDVWNGGGWPVSLTRIALDSIGNSGPGLTYASGPAPALGPVGAYSNNIYNYNYTASSLGSVFFQGRADGIYWGYVPISSPNELSNVITVVSPGEVWADFENGGTGTAYGSGSSSIFGGGTILLINPANGCPYGTPGGCCNLSGTVAQDFGIDPYCRLNLTLLPGGVPAPLDQWAPSRSFNFSYNNYTPGVTYRVVVETSNVTDGYYYEMTFTPTASGWQDITVYFPDGAAPGPHTLAQTGGIAVPWDSSTIQCTRVRIEPVCSSSAPVAFNLDVDDFGFGPPRGTNSPSQAATAMGVSLATAVDAYSLHIDEYMAWVLMRLSLRCGCTPHDLFALRSTMSWGQICGLYGITWEGILAEVDGRTGGLDPPSSSIQEIERTLWTNPPLTPAITPTPYVPGGPLSPLAPGGGC